jgi:bacteriorhodopsin
MPKPSKSYWIEFAVVVGVVLLFWLLVAGTESACERLYARAKTTQDTLIVATSRSGCSLPQEGR